MILIKFARNFFDEKFDVLRVPAACDGTLVCGSDALLAAALLESSLDLTVRIALGCRCTLVVELFTLRKRNQQLDAVMLIKVDLKRDQRQAFLAKLSVKVVNLPAVKQQLALSIWVNVPHAAICIGVQVHAVNPRFTVTNEAERIG